MYHKPPYGSETDRTEVTSDRFRPEHIILSQCNVSNQVCAFNIINGKFYALAEPDDKESDIGIYIHNRNQWL
jgi:hypothetical protein